MFALFGDAVRPARRDAGDERAVAVLGDVVAVDRVVAVAGAAAEVLVREGDAGVDDVDAGAVGVGLVEPQGPLVGAVQTPKGGGLVSATRTA
jgi:hypothetical protein